MVSSYAGALYTAETGHKKVFTIGGQGLVDEVESLGVKVKNSNDFLHTEM